MSIKLLSIGDVSQSCGVPVYTLRRLFDAGKLPPATRVLRGSRIVTASKLPAIRKALVRLGYVSERPKQSDERAADVAMAG